MSFFEPDNTWILVVFIFGRVFGFNRKGEGVATLYADHLTFDNISLGNFSSFEYVAVVFKSVSSTL